MSVPVKRHSEFNRRRAAGLASASAADAFLAMLGKRVRAARERRRWTRKQLAESAEVSERYLAQLEGGAGNASVILLRRVADALGLTLARLLEAEQCQDRARIARFLDSLPPQRLDGVLQRLIREFGSDATVRRKRIVLIGLRGAGKSTLGAALAQELRRPFIELDREIEREAGIGLSEVFLLYGPAGYRQLERRCLERLIDSQDEVVASVGGGVVSEAETFQMLLVNCYTVWIKASPAEHMSRVVAQGDMRPMKGRAQAMQDLKNILSAREPQYARADATVDTSDRSVEKSLAALRRVVASAGRELGER